MKASLVAPWVTGNGIFDAGSRLNRDGTFEPYIRLRAAFLARGVELNTADVNGDAPIAFELHQDVQQAVRQGGGTAPAYLMLFETPVVRPVNDSGDALARYRKVFTWNDALVDGQRFIKINFPNPLVVPAVDGFAQRDRFCCLIAGNKAATQYDPRELYSERVRVIRWFEQHAPADFDLYGIDWDLPPPRPGIIGKVLKRLWRYLSRVVGMRPFPSYRGKVDRKRDVLQKTRYSICYENVRDMPGYITEKMFDCFFAGCVPVYWGANNVTDHVPADCFIDRRQFADTAAVYEHLKSISEEDYRGYQQRIAAFIASDAARPFGSGAFAETIVSTIVQDLERAA